MEQGAEAGFEAVLSTMEPPTPIATTLPETPQQVFTRVLGYADISLQFIESVLGTSRTRTFRKAMVLDEAQLKSISDLSDENPDKGMSFDALQFFSLLKAGDYYVKQRKVDEVPWSTFDEDAVFKLLSDYKTMNLERVEELERTKLESANQSANDFLLGRDSFNPPNNDSLENIMGGSSSASFVKKTLKPFENCKFPSVPVTVKDMKAFKINMTNQLRSMDLDHLLKESYIPPESNEPGFEKYRIDNKFFYSAVVEIMTNPNHPARSWLMTEEIENDGRAAYFKLINHYDNETIEDSHGITAYMRWTNTKLTGVHLGAMKNYITKYQTVLSDAKEAGDAIPDNPAKDMFLAHIKPEEYQHVTMNCKIDKISLSLNVWIVA